MHRALLYLLMLASAVACTQQKTSEKTKNRPHWKSRGINLKYSILMTRSGIH